MKLVRTYKVFGFLRYFSVMCRQKLGAYRRIKYILKRFFEQLVICRLAVVADKMLDKRLGYRAVHTVHRHMIAVVGRPAESKLGQIARAYYKSARLIGDVHKHLCAFSCLTVFKYYR